MKWSVTFDCGFTHAAIKSCISDSKGNALSLTWISPAYLDSPFTRFSNNQPPKTTRLLDTKEYALFSYHGLQRHIV